MCSLTGLRGRWETLREKPLTICDTGHNSHGLWYVAEQLRGLKNPHVWIVFGMVNDKDSEEVLRLMPTGERYHYIFTRPNTQRARTAEEMRSLWESIQPSAFSIQPLAIENPQEAIKYAEAQAQEDDAIFIGGSNYLVGEALVIGDW